MCGDLPVSMSQRFQDTVPVPECLHRALNRVSESDGCERQCPLRRGDDPVSRQLSLEVFVEDTVASGTGNIHHRVDSQLFRGRYSVVMSEGTPP
jgi:hypothetical protein